MPKAELAGETKALAERMKLTLNYDELTNCMRCGFCQPACPTFKETGLEAASPRGRIALMKAVVDGYMAPDETFKAQMDLCLGCRACEPVCPSDVKYGHLLEQTRDAIEQHTEHRAWVRMARSLTFKHLFPHPKRMRMVGLGLKVYQKSGLRAAVRGLGVMKLFPKHMEQMERILPDASSEGVVQKLGVTLYPAAGEKVARVGMFRGCIMDILFTDTNVNTVKLLAECGFEVAIPDSQTCCGALHAHSGETSQAKLLARQNIRAFREAGVDYIVSNAGGCGALLVEYDHLLHDDPEWADDAAWFASKVKDVSQIILEKGRIPQFSAAAAGKPGIAGHGPEAEQAASAEIFSYQDSCHLRNVMRSANAPRNLMSRVENARFVELKQSDRCCGSAGIYNLIQAEMSTQILDHKMEHVKETNASYLLTSNPGCLLQMKLGIEREQMSSRMQAVHIADYLYERIVKK
nr:(Fe-S)-binding protein [Paenibacillus hamazuiensis]